jgi:hypothetical protein
LLAEHWKYLIQNYAVIRYYNAHRIFLTCLAGKVILGLVTVFWVINPEQNWMTVRYFALTVHFTHPCHYVNLISMCFPVSTVGSKELFISLSKEKLFFKQCFQIWFAHRNLFHLIYFCRTYHKMFIYVGKNLDHE